METIKQRFAEHITLAQQVAESRILEQVTASAEIIRQALQNGKKVLFCGNGGSAADSQHLAAEFVGRFQKERNGLPEEIPVMFWLDYQLRVTVKMCWRLLMLPKLKGYSASG